MCLTPSSTRSIVTSVNSCQLKSNVTVHSGTAYPSSAVLCCAVGHCTVRDCTVDIVTWFGIEYGGKGLRYFKGVQKRRGVKNVTYHKTSINAIHGTVQHFVFL